MLSNDELVVVTGAGGFIGGHLVADLLRRGCRRVRAVDIKPLDEWFQLFSAVDNRRSDLRERDACHDAIDGAAWVYNLAADMGGMGFIETHKAACMLSVLINTHLLLAARDLGVRRFFFASSACVYAADKQTSPDIIPLKEEDAYPAMPEDGYGWEKLFSERLCRHFREDYGLTTRVARFHNVYGQHGTFAGGREKAPAAICRKVIEAKLSGRHEIEIWGDGEQTRSFMYIDDCVEGTRLIMHGLWSLLPIHELQVGGSIRWAKGRGRHAAEGPAARSAEFSGPLWERRAVSPLSVRDALARGVLLRRLRP